MAIPFYIPSDGNSDESSPNNSSGEESASSSSQSSPVTTPTRPISIPLRNSNQMQSPSHSPIDNEILVQAFYEALCRCSQGSPMSPPMSPSSPFGHNQFFFPRHMGPSTSTSANSTPRQSFRMMNNARRRLNSHGSYAQYSEVDDEEEIQVPQDVFDWENHYAQREQMDEFTGQVPITKAKNNTTNNNNGNSKQNNKPKKESKITNFVISALQYVIDTLK